MRYVIELREQHGPALHHERERRILSCGLTRKAVGKGSDMSDYCLEHRRAQGNANLWEKTTFCFQLLLRQQCARYDRCGPYLIQPVPYEIIGLSYSSCAALL